MRLLHSAVDEKTNCVYRKMHFTEEIPTSSELAYFCFVKQCLFAGTYDIFYVHNIIHENLQSQFSLTAYCALFHLDS